MAGADRTATALGGYIDFSSWTRLTSGSRSGSTARCHRSHPLDWTQYCSAPAGLASPSDGKSSQHPIIIHI